MGKWYALLLLGICCISTSAILVTVAGVQPTVSAFYRNFFAALIWLALYPISRPFRPMPQRTVSFPWPGWETGRFSILLHGRSAFFFMALLGLFFAVDLWAWHRCIILLGAGPATLMGNLQVLIVSLLAVFFFGERLARWFWPGCFLALAGIGLLTLTREGSQDIFLGLFWGLVTALTYSFFLIVLRVIERFQTTPQQVLFWVAFGTAFFLFWPMIAEGGNILLPAASSLSWLALHALLSSVLGWWLIITAMRRLPIFITATLLLLQPILTSIWGHLFLQQFLAPLQVAGIITALVGIRLAVWQGRDMG